MRSLRLAALQLKRLFTDSLLVRAAVVAVTLVPLLYGALYLWAFWDPYGNLDKMPVALVNLDHPVTVSGDRIDAGADLVTELRKAKSFQWHEVSPAEAAAGVRSGTYYLSLTIPADFSAKLGTAKSGDPQRARLLVVANESHNMLASMIAERAFTEVQSAAGQSASKRYLDKIFVGFADAHGGFTDASAAAKDLASGLADARSGARKLAAGATSASGGASALASGVRAVASGASDAHAGARALASGSGTIADGLATARSGAKQVAGGAATLDGGTKTLAGSLGRLSGGADTLASGAGELSDGAEELKSGVDDALGRVGTATSGAKQVAGGASALDDALNAYAKAHPDAANDADFQQILGISGQVKDGSSQLYSGLKDAGSQGPTLSSGADQVASGAASLAGSTRKLAGGLGQANDGAARLAGGAHTLASGSAQLSSGVVSAASGAQRLAAGSASLADGTRALATGARSAATGATTLSGGISKLDGGAHDLASGLRPAVTGASELSARLRDGAGQVPEYGKALQERNSSMMSAPVALDTTKLGPVPKYGIGFAPYFIPVALWVGALLTFFIVKPLPRRALASGAPAPVSAMAGYLPAAGIGIVQALVLLSVIEFGLGLSPVSPLAFYATGLLTALVFVAILQFLNAAFGAVGKLLSIVLMMLQLTSAGGTFPIQTVPAFLQAINPFMPMTYVVGALREAISGGGLVAVSQDLLVLAAFGAIALIGTVVAATRDQVWTMERLHPTLEL